MPAQAGTAPGVPPAAPKTAAVQGPGLTPFPQQSDSNFETLFAYGESAYGAGEVGEVASTVALIQGDIAAAGATALPAYNSYVTRFVALAERVGKAADADFAAGRLISARGKYLRSASYYNCALFFVLGSDTPSRETELYRVMQSRWAAAAALLNPRYQRVEIPAKIRYPRAGGGTTTRSVKLPAYFARAAGPGRKPTVIVNNGSDAQFIDVFAFGAQAALDRGYNALIFEGPGQGSLLFEQNIPFTPYWQDAVTPLVDYLIEQPSVDPDNLAITGWSFGGLLVFRAAAYEHRLKAVVGDPGFVDNAIGWHALYSALRAFGGVTAANFEQLYASSPKHELPYGQLAMKFTINKRAEIYSAQYRKIALEGKLNTDVEGFLQHITSYNAGPELLARVRAHVLINSYQEDAFFPADQAIPLKAGLTGAASVATHEFTVADGAEYHCAPMAPQVRNEVVYDWMDGIFSAGAAPGGGPGAGKRSGGNAVPLGIVAGTGVVIAGAVALAESHRPAEPAAPSQAPPSGVPDPRVQTPDEVGDPRPTAGSSA